MAEDKVDDLVLLGALDPGEAAELLRAAPPGVGEADRKAGRLRFMVKTFAAAFLFLSSGSLPAAGCPEVQGLDPLLEPGAVLLVGEMHGTEQAPAFVRDVACAASSKGLPISVGLEVDRAEDEAFQAYLQSDGGTVARERLLAASFWQREFQDGRSSRAMLGLMEDLRKLAAGAGELQVFLIDRPEPPAKRDAAMAERVAESVAARPGDLLVVLTGNIHNRLTRGMPWNAELEPMGYLLAKRLPKARIVSLDMAYPGGTAWVCFGSAPSDCRAQELGGSKAAADRSGVELLENPAGEPYTGRYFTGPLTASEPAIAPPSEAAVEPASAGAEGR